jgi:hypothetical protein
MLLKGGEALLLATQEQTSSAVDPMTDTFEQKTIRDPLLGMVADHLGKGQINCGITQQVGCELVSLLSAYREEDRRLFPQVYLFGPSQTGILEKGPRNRGAVWVEREVGLLMCSGAMWEMH